MLIGIEVEAGNIAREYLEKRLSSMINSRFGWSLHDDGSIRTHNYIIAEVPIVPIITNGRALYPAGARRFDNYGPEVVSVPLNRDDAFEFCLQLSKVLCKLPPNPRSSIHIHVSGFNGWKHIQNLLAWMYYFEAPLYRIAGLGQRHRGELSYQGESNDYRFCRPLSAPIGLRTADTRVPLINIGKLLTAKTFGEMLYAWGRLDYFWALGELNHYCPHRLHGINLASLLRHRTIEFRLWNGVHKYLSDALQISLRLVDLAADGPPNLDMPMLLGSEPDFTAEDLSSILKMDVRHLWGSSWPAPVIVPNLMSHYSNHNDLVSSRQGLQECVWDG